jgi:hypothetical protein
VGVQIKNDFLISAQKSALRNTQKILPVVGGGAGGLLQW